MREVVLLQKVHHRSTMKSLGRFLRDLCKGLRAELHDLTIVGTGWAQVKIHGEDENVSARFLEKAIGLAPVNFHNVRPPSALRGSIMFSGRDNLELFVDVGVFSPHNVFAVIPLRRLQAQLVDGRRLPLKRITEMFGLINDTSFEVRILRGGTESFEAEVGDAQMELYRRWIASRLDRLTVLGVSSKEVERAVTYGKLRRDTLGVESLGFAEHSIACKLGTDAVGLISKLGRLLPAATFATFSPRRILTLTPGRW